MFRIKAHMARARAFRGDENGAAGIEFALIAPVLFFALLSLIELGVLGMMTSSLNNAVIDASRHIRTGREDAASSASTFEDQICARIPFGSCRDRLVISVQRFAAFANASTAVTERPQGQFDKGGPSDIILVKADYRWPLLSPFVATAFDRAGPMEINIASRFAFKNEPFE